MKIILVAALLIAASSLTYAQTDRDTDNAGQWDYGRAGTDRYLDGGDRWNPDPVGKDKNIDNDVRWDSNHSGSDRYLDNNGQWDSSRVAPIKFSIVTVSGVPTMVVKIGI